MVAGNAPHFWKDTEALQGFEQMEALQRDLPVAGSCVSRARCCPSLGTASLRRPVTPAPRAGGPLFLGLNTDRATTPLSFQREIGFRTKANRKENTPGKNKNTNAQIHMNTKQKVKLKNNKGGKWRKPKNGQHQGSGLRLLWPRSRLIRLVRSGMSCFLVTVKPPFLQVPRAPASPPPRPLHY